MGSGSEHLCCIPGTSKGQKISKPKYIVFNSSKKRTKYLPDSALATSAEVFLFFLEELRTKKFAFEIF